MVVVTSVRESRHGIKAKEEAQGDLEESWDDRRQPGLVSSCPGTSQEYSCRGRICSQIRKAHVLFYVGGKGWDIIKRKQLGRFG